MDSKLIVGLQFSIWDCDMSKLMQYVPQNVSTYIYFLRFFWHIHCCFSIEEYPEVECDAIRLRTLILNFILVSISQMEIILTQYNYGFWLKNFEHYYIHDWY